MSKYRLEITLDRSGKRFQAGETVSGNVHVFVEKEVSCKELSIELIWETHGRGNTARETVAREPIGPVEWYAGSSYTYPFSLQLPGKPLTYRGTNLNIDYFVTARADIPWAVDPKTREEILVEPGPDSRETYRDAESDAALKPKKKSGIIGTVFGWIFGIIFLALLAALFAAFWWIFAIIALVILIRKAMISYANKRLGNVEVDCEPRVVPGQTLPVVLRFNPPGDVAINRIQATLIGKEVVTSGSGSNSHTYTNELHKEIRAISETYTAHGRSYQNFAIDLAMPNIPAYSFKTKDNRIDWNLALHIDIPRYPDWKHDIDLQLVPDNQPRNKV